MGHDHPVRLLDALQDFLQALYGLDTEGHRVVDYLITEPEVARALAPEPGKAAHAQERLLLRARPDGLELGLFLDPALLRGLPAAERLGTLRAEQVDAFCKVRALAQVPKGADIHMVFQHGVF